MTPVGLFAVESIARSEGPVALALPGSVLGRAIVAATAGPVPAGLRLCGCLFEVDKEALRELLAEAERAGDPSSAGEIGAVLRHLRSRGLERAVLLLGVPASVPA